MRIDFDAEPIGGLQILPFIPPGSIQRLEGRNGIGKTVAVNLLLLCTGTQPYVGRQASWRTLREQLGVTRIRVGEMADGDELQFELIPDGWPEQPEPVGQWLGVALHNSEPIAWHQVPEIFRVTRIGGDETLGESLAGEVVADRERLRILASAQEARRQVWGEQTAKLLRQTAFARGLDLRRLSQDVVDTRAKHSAAKRAVETAQDRVDVLRSASVLLQKASALETQLPRMDEQLVALAAQEAVLRDQISEVDVEVAQHLAASQASKDQTAEAARLTNLLRLRRDRRIRRRRELDLLAAEAGVSTPVDLNAVSVDRHSIQREIAELRRKRLAVDRVGLVLELIADVSRPVSRAVDRGLRDEVVAELPGGSFTVGALSTGLSERQETLGGVSSDEARLLAEEIQRAEQQLSALGGLPDLVRLRDKAEADVEETNQSLEDLLRVLGGSSSAYREAVERRAVLLDQLTEISVARGDLEAQVAAQLVGGSADELRAEAATLTAGLQLAIDLTVDALAEALPDSLRIVDSALGELGIAQRNRDEAGNRLADSEAAARASVATLIEDPDLAWLGAEGLMLLPSREGNAHDQIVALSNLERAATSLSDALLQTLNDVQALETALDELASRLRAMTVGKPGTGRLSIPVRRHYEAVFGRELGEYEELRDALFDGSRQVTVDLREMSVAWATLAGVRQSRPLESFSSGQRAFAYTRVQMERQARVQSRNRMMVLDEFGAFIAQDRFDMLVHYLSDRAYGLLADQILLILPIRQRVGELAAEAPDYQGDGYIVNNVG